MTRRAFSRPFVAVLSLLAANACVSVTPPRFLQSVPDREWTTTVDRARELAAQGQTPRADSLLAAYAMKHPTAPQAIETNYWRSVLSLQSPGNPEGTAFAIPMLEFYLAANRQPEHRLEAVALLGAVARIDTLSRAAATLVSRVQSSNGDVVSANARAADAKAETKTVTSDTKDQDAEIRRLKDELAKSKEELERIKKRLAEPPKKPPRSE